MEEIDIEICLIKVNKNCKNIYIYKKTTVKQRNYHYKKFIFYF